jgi:hypothetical protein
MERTYVAAHRSALLKTSKAEQVGHADSNDCKEDGEELQPDLIC